MFRLFCTESEERKYAHKLSWISTTQTKGGFQPSDCSDHESIQKYRESNHTHSGRKHLSWGEVEYLSDHELISIFESPPAVNPLNYVQPDYAKLSKELTRPGVTMQLLWEEYQDQCRLSKTLGYQATQFKKYFNEYRVQNQFTEVIRHKAGERIEVDWAGTRVRWMDPDTGEVILGYLFVGVLSFSGYAYAQACPDMTQASWIDAHNQMFHYFGGV